MRVLVAEDDPDIQAILRMVLTRLGKCDVIMTDQGDDVVRLAVESSPDLVILDVMLPGKNGFEICRALKDHPSARNIPVIFLTARVSPSDIQEAKKVGAVGYLAKPFDPMTLVPQINGLLSTVGCAIG